MNEKTQKLIQEVNNMLHFDFINEDRECEVTKAIGRLELSNKEAKNILKEFILAYSED